MKNFFVVFKFELLGYLKNKAFIVSTVLICLLLAVGLCIPTIMNTFFSPAAETTTGQSEEVQDRPKIYGYIDLNHTITNIDDLTKNFYIGELKEVNSVDELEEMVNSEEISAGYIIEGFTRFNFIVKNNQMLDSSKGVFENALAEAFRINEFEQRGIEYSQVSDLINPNIVSSIKILGKDSVNNYIYTYILVFGLYFVIILYGQFTATSVASEKSNRTMEILITSTKSRNLIFGKVLGGVLAGLLQFGVILVTAKVVYSLNAVGWDHKLDFIFNIPGAALAKFSVFGILGYIFYSFIYGAVGALVSRTEDVNSSATPITLLLVGVFMISVLGMQHTEGVLLKVASFLPFSSFMAMFVRVSMGTVSNLEITISLIILLASTVIIGVLGSMIYRMGTLMYGNPVKLKDVVKLLKSQ